MGDKLKDKVAVVTGSGRGIGKSIVMAMATEGAQVVVNDLGGGIDGTGGSKVADEVVDEIKRAGGTAVANYDSVASHEGADNIIKTAVDNFGRIDILVNNAGIVRDRMLWNMTDEEFDAVIKTHLYGHFYCTRAAVIQMRDAIKEGKQKNGRLINFSSQSAIKGNAGQPNYGSAKAGVIGFTYSCSLALWRFGITSNAIVPRAMTRITDNMAEDQVRKLAAGRGFSNADTAPIEIVKKSVMGGSSDAIAPVVCWLASDKSQNVNGQVFAAMEGRVSAYSQMDEAKSAFSTDVFSMDEIWHIMPEITAGLHNAATDLQ